MSFEEFHFIDSMAEKGAARNTVDAYKDKMTSEIRATLDEQRSEMVNICMNLSSDFNKSSVVRASNAFLGQEVWIVGNRKFDRRGAVGTHHYEHIKYSPDYQELFDHLIADGYTIFPVDNREEFNPKVINEMIFPAKSAFLYGEEMLGLDDDVIKACNGDMIYIRQRGSVRSLNVAQAAAVTMCFYDSQHVDF